MKANLAKILKVSPVNGWGLFAIFSIPMCLFNYIVMMDADISTPEGVSYMIGYSVRWAVPFIYLAMVASSVKILFPGAISFWWLRNRKYIGLVFALGMAWQAVFIYILSTFYRDYYFDEVYYFRDELEGSVGYIFLVGMVITSFKFARSKISNFQWKWIQKGGLYFLWAYAFSVYWWNVFYYPYYDNYSVPEIHDYLYYWIGFVVFALRVVAWGKQRLKIIDKNSELSGQLSWIKMVGVILFVLGVVMSGTGHHWYEAVSGLISAPEWSIELGLWLPFWPLEPFISLLLMSFGAYLITSERIISNHYISAVD